MQCFPLPNQKNKLMTHFKGTVMVLTLTVYLFFIRECTAYQFERLNTAVGARYRHNSQLSPNSRFSHLPVNRRTTCIKGTENEEVDNSYFQQLGFRRIVREKKESTFIGPNDAENQSVAGLLKYFVPGFVALWAAGYGAVFLAEISGNGLGDTGGFIGAGLAVFLLLALVGAAGYEVFKPLPSENTL
jgi:hypothetical protein